MKILYNNNIKLKMSNSKKKTRPSAPSGAEITVIAPKKAKYAVSLFTSLAGLASDIARLFYGKPLSLCRGKSQAGNVQVKANKDKTYVIYIPVAPYPTKSVDHRQVQELYKDIDSMIKHVSGRIKVTAVYGDIPSDLSKKKSVSVTVTDPVGEVDNDRVDVGGGAGATSAVATTSDDKDD
jgi:hypothetical protein